MGLSAVYNYNAPDKYNFLNKKLYIHYAVKKNSQFSSF